jgi:hypothetical protein
MMVKSDGMSTYSAMTFTPPSEMSVIVQSRGSEPVPNWIFASRLHRRRSLVRRFASISILRLARELLVDPALPPPYSHFTQETLESAYWDGLQFIHCFCALFTELASGMTKHPKISTRATANV